MSPPPRPPMPSMPFDDRDTARWLNDIRHHIAMASSFASGMSYEAFKDDLRTVYAVTRCLEIISEASRRLPAELKARHPLIEWQQMAASGNFYRHEYEDVAARRVWETLGDHLPPLQDVIVQELKALDGQP